MNSRWFNCNESYDERIKIMAEIIQPNSTVLDIGCGKEALRKYIPNTVKYYGCDLVKRSDDTIVCDFNRGIYPPIKRYDYVFCSGVLEYINDLEHFLNTIKNYGECLIVSYAPKTTDIDDRIRSGWVNHYTYNELVDLFNQLGYWVITETTWKNQNIFYLTNII